MLKQLQKLPDEKKKIYAAAIAFILTAIIATLWFVFRPKEKNSAPAQPIISADEMNSFKASWQESVNQFDEMKAEIFGTTTATSTDNATISAATSSISTTTEN